MPQACASQFVLPRDNFAAKIEVPDDREGVIWLTGHTPDLTAADVEPWVDNGWTLGTMTRKYGYDALVFGGD